MTLSELRASRAAVLSVTQVVEVLADVDGHRPDPRTVRRAAEAGQLPAIHVGRRLLILRAPLLAILDGDRAVAAGGDPRDAA